MPAASRHLSPAPDRRRELPEAAPGEVTVTVTAPRHAARLGSAPLHLLRRAPTSYVPCVRAWVRRRRGADLVPRWPAWPGEGIGRRLTVPEPDVVRLPADAARTVRGWACPRSPPGCLSVVRAAGRWEQCWYSWGGVVASRGAAGRAAGARRVSAAARSGGPGRPVVSGPKPWSRSASTTWPGWPRVVLRPRGRRLAPDPLFGVPAAAVTADAGAGRSEVNLGGRLRTAGWTPDPASRSLRGSLHEQRPDREPRREA